MEDALPTASWASNHSGGGCRIEGLGYDDGACPSSSPGQDPCTHVVPV